jgi:Zn-dependent alcohol dehydrogenase
MRRSRAMLLEAAGRPMIERAIEVDAPVAGQVRLRVNA